MICFTAQEQTGDVLIQEIQKANVICVVYAVDDDDTIDKVWIQINLNQF